ncbi:hypothetical protein [Tessaracoccus massiliensis]|uniref:hypothetical protein n=1 Tax=Tessaracoccus massiliensis TaxID=1522311 RepID=UPI001119197F|nr:hypothetical protein [Tessaracoccus massiliensis]
MSSKNSKLSTPGWSAAISVTTMAGGSTARAGAATAATRVAINDIAVSSATNGLRIGNLH